MSKAFDSNPSCAWCSFCNTSISVENPPTISAARSAGRCAGGSALCTTKPITVNAPARRPSAGRPAGQPPVARILAEDVLDQAVRQRSHVHEVTRRRKQEYEARTTAIAAQTRRLRTSLPLPEHEERVGLAAAAVHGSARGEIERVADDDRPGAVTALRQRRQHAPRVRLRIVRFVVVNVPPPRSPPIARIRSWKSTTAIPLRCEASARAKSSGSSAGRRRRRTTCCGRSRRSARDRIQLAAERDEPMWSRATGSGAALE